jgi:hypothetical protein
MTPEIPEAAVDGEYTLIRILLTLRIRFVMLCQSTNGSRNSIVRMQIPSWTSWIPIELILHPSTMRMNKSRRPPNEMVPEASDSQVVH